MKLSELVAQDGEVDARFAALDIACITADSRKVMPGCLFVAVPGTKQDGLAFVPQALRAGAAAILAEHAPDPLPAGAIKKRCRPISFRPPARRAGVS